MKLLSLAPMASLFALTSLPVSGSHVSNALTLNSDLYSIKGNHFEINLDNYDQKIVDGLAQTFISGFSEVSTDNKIEPGDFETNYTFDKYKEELARIIKHGNKITEPRNATVGSADEYNELYWSMTTFVYKGDNKSASVKNNGLYKVGDKISNPKFEMVSTGTFNYEYAYDICDSFQYVASGNTFYCDSKKEKYLGSFLLDAFYRIAFPTTPFDIVSTGSGQEWSMNNIARFLRAASDNNSIENNRASHIAQSIPDENATGVWIETSGGFEITTLSGKNSIGGIIILVIGFGALGGPAVMQYLKSRKLLKEPNNA